MPNIHMRKSLENQRSQIFERDSARHRNCIRINSGNTLEHELEKTRICMKLREEEHSFLCEAITQDRKCRCDVVDITGGVCYEIVNSESEESIVKKKGTYPFPIEIIRVGKEAKP